MMGGGIFSDSIITNVLLILTVEKKFETFPIVDEVLRRTKSVPYFWATLYAGSPHKDDDD